MFEKIYALDKDGIERKLSAEDLQILVNTDALSDLNLIYRSNGKDRFVTFRLASFMSAREGKKPERVTKFLIEAGTYDENKPAGSRQKDYVQIYMDEDEFSYFCDLMRGGRIVDVIERNERIRQQQGLKYAPMAYLHHSGTSEAKRLRIYKGKAMPIVLEIAKGPGKKGEKGQVEPDNWQAQKDKVTTIYAGLDEKEASKIGAAGARAIAILDYWRAFGRDEENLKLINITKKRKSAENQGQQRQQPAQGYGRPAHYQNDYGYSDGYAASPRQGYGNSGGYQRGQYQNGGFAATQQQGYGGGYRGNQQPRSNAAGAAW